MENSIIRTLEEIKFTQAENFEPYFPRVRDREDVSVLICKLTQVLILNRTDHQSIEHYEQRDDFNYWGSKSRKEAAQSTAEETALRKKRIADRVAGAHWLDVGTGAGGILDELRSEAASCAAVEPHKASRKALSDDGYKVFARAEELPKNQYDVVTLFHSLEHFVTPIPIMKSIYQSMRPGGSVRIEVPHAKDALISRYESAAFKNFTFWSEHLILHTQASLIALLKYTGFENIKVSGLQRYPLSNHLYWLSKGKPGGHEIWADLSTTSLSISYEATLKELDMTDTLIVWAEKPKESHG